jgi:hypothetical protein
VEPFIYQSFLPSVNDSSLEVADCALSVPRSLCWKEESVDCFFVSHTVSDPKYLIPFHNLPCCQTTILLTSRDAYGTPGSDEHKSPQESTGPA